MIWLLTTEPSFIVLPNWEFPITPNVTQRASIPTCQPCTKGLASVSALASRILILENGIVMEWFHGLLNIYYIIIRILLSIYIYIMELICKVCCVELFNMYERHWTFIWFTLVSWYPKKSEQLFVGLCDDMCHPCAQNISADYIYII